MSDAVPDENDACRFTDLMRQSIADTDCVENARVEKIAAEIQRRIREGERKAVGERLLKKVHEFYQQQLLLSKREVTREIRAALGVLVERYGASSGTVFLVEGFRIRSAASHFGIPLDESIVFDEQIFSETGNPARIVSAALAINERSNHCEVLRLLEPISRAPLGFILLEWNEHSEPMSDSIRTATETDALRMVVPVLCLQRTDSRSQYATPWTPLASGWTFKRFLTLLCEVITHTLQDEYSDSQYSATVWTIDWSAKRLWARATFGFDEEYVTDERALPWNNSLVQQIAQANHHECLMIEDPSTSAFLRKDKILRYGLSKIVGMPIYRSQDSNNQASAVIVIYHFGDARLHPKPFPLTEVCQEIGLMLEKWIESYHCLRHEAAIGYARWKMEECRKEAIVEQLAVAKVSAHHPRSALWNAFKDILVTCLKPDGCSVFLNRNDSPRLPAEKNQQELVLVATTGVLDAEWDTPGWNILRPADAGRISYQSSVPRHNESILMYLFRHPDRAPLRIPSLLDWQSHLKVEDLDLRSDEPVPKLCSDLLERISPETADRRFLATVLQPQHGGTCRGVIRLVRSSRSKPFSSDDEGLLQRLCTFFINGEYEFLSLPQTPRLIPDDQLPVGPHSQDVASMVGVAAPQFSHGDGN